MRIISGKYRGKVLRAPKKLPVRPTTDMAKEALFNILNNQYFIPDLAIVDLFAGIGSISLEFASRGATRITAVDSHAGCVRFIASTAAALDLPIHTVKSDAFQYLKRTRDPADLIFADPPYDQEHDRFAELVSLVFEQGLLARHGRLIIEHSKRTNLSALPHFEEARTYGGSTFSFFPASIADT